MKKNIKIYIDQIDNNTIQGWFVNSADPENNKVLLYLDGQYKSVTVANIERQDVADAHGKLDSGFSFDIRKYPVFQNIEIRSDNKDLLLSIEGTAQNSKILKHDQSVDIGFYSQERNEQLDQITIDLSRPINGSNWYDIEPIGRWAGPELESTLIIPALFKGKYQMQLEIANAFCDLKAMQVIFNGKPVKFLKTEYQAPVILKANVSVEKELACWQINFKFSETYPPDGESGADQRRLGIFLKAVIMTQKSTSKSKII